MTTLIIATDTAILRHDTELRETFIVDNSRPGYYGISWFPDDERLFLTHSDLKFGRLGSQEAYMRSEVGYISDGTGFSAPILSNPHQICCLTPPFLAATNTGRNAIFIVNTDDWSFRQLRFDEVFWDRYDSAGQGSHFNSIEFDGEKIWILAHNFDAGSYALSLDWPKLDNLRKQDLPGRQMHNIWHRTKDQCISCDSPNGALIDVGTGEQLWHFPEQRFYARGLACAEGRIFVGATQFADRDARESTISRVFVVDAETYQTLDEIHLGAFGGVNEIRVLGALDLCHPHGIRKFGPEMTGVPAGTGIAGSESIEAAPGPKAAPRQDLAAIIQQRDDQRDIAIEAVKQLERITGERLAMMLERDRAWGERDEARSQQTRLQGELDARIIERDEARSMEAEARTQIERITQECQAMMLERDRAWGEADRAGSQRTRLPDEVQARIVERGEAPSVSADVPSQLERVSARLKHWRRKWL